VRFDDGSMEWDRFRDAYCKRHHTRGTGAQLQHMCFLADNTPTDKRGECDYTTCPAVHEAKHPEDVAAKAEAEKQPETHFKPITVEEEVCVTHCARGEQCSVSQDLEDGTDANSIFDPTLRIHLRGHHGRGRNLTIDCASYRKPRR